MTRLCSIILALVGTAEVFGQSSGVLQIDTNYPESIVYVDSLRLGQANEGAFYVRAGQHTLRLFPPGEAAWSVAPLEKELTISSQDTMFVKLDFLLHHRVNSSPPGAAVFLTSETEPLSFGETPTTFTTTEAVGLIELRLQGYQSQEIPLRSEIWNLYEINLSPLLNLEGEQGILEVPKRRRWITISAAALVVAGGVLAVHHKFKADRLNDSYQETGDPALRPRIARLDDRSAIALIGMQAGLITIGVRFFLSR